MTHTDARASKLKKSLAIAQAGILMLGLIVMSAPTPAHATEFPSENQSGWQFGLDHQNHVIHIKKVIDGGNARADQFSVTVSHHNFFLPIINGSEVHQFDVNGNITISPSIFTVYSVVENDPGEDYSASYDNCTDIHNATCTITNIFKGEPEPTTGSIEITKYFCPEGTTVKRSENGVVGEVPEGCVPGEGVDFGYVHGQQTDANGPYPELSAPLTDAGATGENGVLTITDLDPSGRYLIEETNSDNQRLSDSEVLGLYCEGDGDTSDNNDNQELTFVTAGETAKCVAYDVAPAKSCTIVSDSSTLADGNPSVELAYTDVTSGAWTHLLDGFAKWVWGENPTDTASDKVETFTKTFGLTNAPTTAYLTLAADNGFTVTVNSTVVDNSQASTEFNYGTTTNPYDIASLLHTGNNTITVTVKNLGAGSHANPAGVIFKADVTGANCKDVTQEVPNTLKVHILKYLQVGESLQPVVADSGAPAFPMNASWSATNIGSGSGSYTLNAAGFGGAGAYAADTSPMSIPADYSTYEVPNGTTVLAPDTTCAPGAYRLVGYKSGDTLNAALNASLSTSVPTFSGLTADKYVLVVNEKCSDQPANTVTIHAQKVICDNPADLPHNLSGGPDITATTASDWIETHASCHLADWDFQWAPEGTSNPGDNTVGTPEGWTSFSDFAWVPEGALVWIREAIDTSYIPFVGTSNEGDSAQVYCSSDVLNYDNYDFIDQHQEASDYYCVAFNAPVAAPQTPNDDRHGTVQTESGSNNGDVGDGGNGGGSSNDGEVAGASTEACVPLLTTYLKMGWKNDPEEVKKLQQFLADHLGTTLPVTGFFGPLTFNAVKVFQKGDWEDVLKPWISVPGSGITGQDTPTGFVYKTTKWHINNLVCPGSEEFPTDLN